MESTGKIVGLDLDFLNHKPKLTIQLNRQDILTTDEFTKLKELDKINITIEEITQKRGLNANSALWKLCTLIADKLGTSKEEIYLEQLKKYGQSLLIPVLPDTKPNGYFKYYEFREKGRVNGKECDWYIVYKGSSEYTTKEMSILLEGTNNDCKELGIETIEEYKLRTLIKEWNND